MALECGFAKTKDGSNLRWSMLRLTEFRKAPERICNANAASSIFPDSQIRLNATCFKKRCQRLPPVARTTGAAMIRIGRVTAACAVFPTKVPRSPPKVRVPSMLDSLVRLPFAKAR